MGKYWMLYFLVANVVAFFMYGLDKSKAKRNRYRIPEAWLLGIAALGGFVGAFVGMHCFHHKTRKPKFYLGVPVIAILYIAGWIYVLEKL